jgi:hypothetical protein
VYQAAAGSRLDGCGGIDANIRKIWVRYLLFIHANYCLVNNLKRPISLKLALWDAGVRRALGVSEQDLIGDDLTRCQEIAQYARNAGYDAILAPSAALKRTLTLAIFASAAQKVTEQHSHIGRPLPRTRHVLARTRHKA